MVSAHGGVRLTSPNQYLLAHHLPNWYPHLQEFTPETVVLGLEENLEARLSELGWERYFVKDYVKSLKTSVGSMIERPEQIATVVSVDVVQRTDGAERIVEIGDGQVSDIVGWRPERFAEIWHEYANRRSTATR